MHLMVVTKGQETLVQGPFVCAQSNACLAAGLSDMSNTLATVLLTRYLVCLLQP